MNARLASLLVSLASALGLATLAGCSILPESGSDPARFYLLAAPTAATAPRPDAPSVQVRPIDLVAYLRGGPIIVRRGDNEIEFRDFARWGEPLEQGIARVIREELVARGAASAVQIAGGRRDHRPADFTLTVRVLACEGGANGEIWFRTVWELAAYGENPRVAGGGEFRPADLRWDGKTEASLAAQLSVAVSGLAGEIAAALKK